ncbi:MAG TPA: metallophosphoesterase [Magnetospirillaceae bacterium]
MSSIRIGLMSDVHVEFDVDWQKRIRRAGPSDDLSLLEELDAEVGHPKRGPDLRPLKAAAVDLFLLAGDIGVGLDAIAYADQAAQYLDVDVFAVSGNHEAYNRYLPKFTGEVRAAAAATNGRVSYLERDRVDRLIRGQRVAIFGATLWTDYSLHGAGQASMFVARERMKDYRKIRYSNGRFLPQHARAIHLATRQWLSDAMLQARAENDWVVIMTHHAPIPDAVGPADRDDTAPAYATDLRPQIESWQPDLWVWGHTHYGYEGQLGKTLLRSAPRGYVGVQSIARTFSPGIIELVGRRHG